MFIRLTNQAGTSILVNSSEINVVRPNMTTNTGSVLDMVNLISYSVMESVDQIAVKLVPVPPPL